MTTNLPKAYDKEAVFDREVQPLIDALKAKCKKHELPVLVAVTYACKHSGGTRVSHGTSNLGWAPSNEDAPPTFHVAKLVLHGELQDAFDALLSLGAAVTDKQIVSEDTSD